MRLSKLRVLALLTATSALAGPAVSAIQSARPAAAAIPVDHVVVMMQENHAADH